MSGANVIRQLGNTLYRVAFPLYRPLYSAFKARADRLERNLLQQMLREGAVAVDAGANIGIYSCFLSHCVGSSGKVFSFEPSAANFGHLVDATRRLTNVHPYQAAVGATSGEQLLYESDDLNVDHRLYPTNDPRRTVIINVTSLDDFFAPGTRVDLIKMDIQGYELHALAGARRVLAENPEVKLLLEFWPYGLRQAGSAPRELLALLKEEGFHLHRLGAQRTAGDGYEETMDNNRESYFNIFAQRTASLIPK